jgi:hypothetical protein
MHMIASTHSNDANYFSMQIASDFYSNDIYYRSVNNNGNTAWSRFLLSTNFTSFAMSNQNDVWNRTREGQDRFYFSPSGRTFYKSGNGHEFRAASDAYIGEITNGGAWIASADMRAPIFYDNNNTAYFLDAGGDSGVRAAFLNGNILINPRSESYGEGIAFLLPSQGTWGGLRWKRSNSDFTGAWAFGYFGNETNNDIGFHNGTNGWRLDHSFNNTVNGSFRAPIFYDSNDTGYYVDPNGSLSQFRGILANNWFRAQGDTGFYFESYGYGMWSAHSGGNSYGNVTTYNGGRNGWTGWGIGSRHVFMSTTGDNVGVHDNSRGWIWYWDGGYTQFPFGYTFFGGSARSPIFYDNDNTGYYADFASTGDSIRAAGNIVAYYSDDRLKTRFGNITNAIDKVRMLNGFYYEANETAQKFGYKVKREVGVSAQELQAVLPEVVKDAPIGHGYLTVDYERIVPLLIEAIKELTAKVEALEAK